MSYTKQNPTTGDTITQAMLRAMETQYESVVPDLPAYSESKTAPSIVAGVLTLNLAASNHFVVAFDADITTLTISGVPASGKAAPFMLTLVANGTPHTVAWGASVNWAYDVAPTLTSTNAHWDIFTFISYDGGTTWSASVYGQNFG